MFHPCCVVCRICCILKSVETYLIFVLTQFFLLLLLLVLKSFKSRGQVKDLNHFSTSLLKVEINNITHMLLLFKPFLNPNHISRSVYVSFSQKLLDIIKLFEDLIPEFFFDIRYYIDILLKEIASKITTKMHFPIDHELC